MKNSLIISLFINSFLFCPNAYCQTNIRLQGVIGVWNEKSSDVISLLDDFYYGLCPGDKLKITVTGSANLAPYDEERKKGGFLGMFKKSYTVRIDNWVAANDAAFGFEVSTESREVNGNVLTDYEWVIPYDSSNGQSLKNVYRLKAYINKPRSPIRAGQYQIKVEVDSRERISFLKGYFSTIAGSPILSFKDLKEYVEAGKIIYKHPDEVVQVIEETFVANANLAIIQKDLYQYLLSFSPNNTGVRKKLADVYLKEFNFSEAMENAKKVIEVIYANHQGQEAQFAPQEQADLGSAYETLGSVDEQKQLGLDENAYTKASFFFGESAKWFLASGSLDEYSESTAKQVRCLQKINNTESLKTAILLLNKQIEAIMNTTTR